MLEVTVKTLDSQNHSFTVPDDSTVKEFKEQISPVLNISVEKQRLIFCGKVLKDDKKLSEYDVNGKVIHVVQSLPPQGNNTTSSSNTSSNTTSGGSRPGHRDAAGFVLGAFTIPQDLIDPTQVQNIVQEVVSGMGEIGRNATVMSRTSEDGSSVDVHINLGQVPLQSEAQLRMNRAQTMLIHANRLLELLEDGNNSNNGGNSADSSSQTDETEEARGSPVEADTGSAIPQENDSINNSASDSALSSESQRADTSGSIPPEISIVTQTSGRSGSERYRFEGLAHAAQAALSAAFATAAAAARAATASVSSPVVNTNNSRTSEPEPMDSTTTETDSSNPLESASSGDASAIPMELEMSTPLDETSVPKQNETEAKELRSDTSSSDTQSSGATTSRPVHGGRMSAPREVVQPSVQTLANLLDEVIRVNARLEPCLERCRDLIRSDPPLSGRRLGDAHRLFNRISQLLHFLSHAFHSLSDLHINFSQTPPRNPRVRLISSTPASVMHGMPMQAHISISTTSSTMPSSNPSTTTTANNTTTESTPSTTTESIPVPRVISSVSSSRPETLPSSSAPTPSAISAVIRNPNPLVFMEVSPGSITIDSISGMEATINNAGRATSTPSANRETSVPSQTNDQPSGGQFATSAERPSGPNVRYSEFGAQVGNPVINIPFRNVIPVPLTSMGSLHTFDSGLPCHSVWALEPSRRRHNAGGSRTASTSVGNVTPNAPGRQDEQLQNMISSMMSLLQSNVPGQANQVTPGVTLLSSASGDGVRSGRFLIESTTVRGLQPRSGSSENVTTTETAGASSRNNPPVVDDEMFVHLIDGFMASATGQHHRTIADILSSVNSNLQFDEQDIIGNLMWFIAGKLSFQDLLEISFGNFQSLNRLKEPLQNYIQEKILCSSSTQKREMDSVVTQILADINTILNLLVGNVGVRNGINYQATMLSFFRQSIPKLFDSILSPPESATENFGQYLFDTCKRLFLEFLYLHNHCVENGNSMLERIAVERIDSMATGISSPLRLAMLSLASRSILNANSEDGYEAVLDHVVHMPPATDDANKTAKVEQKSAGGGASRASKVKSNDQRTNHQPRSESVRNSQMSASMSSGIYEGREATPTLAALAHIAERTSALLRNNARSSGSRNSVTEVVIGSESWHNTLPRDWVPIIARDVQRQRRQAPQAPFSNAYLSGMPSKRRKIMTNGASVLVGNTQSTLSDMLMQAVSSASVKPMTSVEELKKDASDDIPLQNAFNVHMKNAIQERLQRDLDYCSERFPNSEKYYNIDRL